MSPHGGKGKEEEGKGKGVSAVTTADAPLSNLLADLIAANDPNGKRPEVGARWVDAERLLQERDGRTSEQIEAIVRWSQADEFWRGNILSMPKLREKFGQLWQQAQRGGGKANGVSADIARLEQHRRRLEAEEAVA